MPAGRPTKYDKEIHPRIVFRLALSGFKDSEIAENLCISESTFHKWKLEHPEFSESIREAKEDADTRVINSLYHKALGYSHKETKTFLHDGEVITEEIIKHHPPDTKAAQFWLKNRKADRWKDKQEVEHTADEGIAELLRARRKRAEVAPEDGAGF